MQLISATTSDEILSQIEANFRSGKPLQLLNVFRGIPITYEAQISVFSQGYVVLNTHAYSAACIALEKRTYLQSEFIPQPVRGYPLSVNVCKAEVVLSRFSTAESTIGKRLSPRVQPKEPLQIDIHTSEATFMVALADISPAGVGVFTFATETEANIPLRRNDEVRFETFLPEIGQSLAVTGKVTHVTRERDTRLVRLGIQTPLDSVAHALVQEYIDHRTTEIMSELESVYQTMCHSRR
jgi:hypothetical protein